MPDIFFLRRKVAESARLDGTGTAAPCELDSQAVNRELVAREIYKVAAFGDDAFGRFDGAAFRVGAGYRAGVRVADDYPAIVAQEFFGVADAATIADNFIF